MISLLVIVLKKFITKGDGGDFLFDERGGPAFIFGSNPPIFWLHA